MEGSGLLLLVLQLREEVSDGLGLNFLADVGMEVERSAGMASVSRAGGDEVGIAL